MSHYYKNDENLAHQEIKIRFDYQGLCLKFQSDLGVFSKDKIDEGSKTLLDYLVKLDLKGKLLDVGCGYGLLGVTLGKLVSDLQITMVDVNLRAIELSKLNAVTNQVNVEVKLSDGYQEIKDNYDLIISNPPIRAGKAVVTRILVEAFDHLMVDGQLIVVIRKSHGAMSALKQLQTTFSNGEIVKKNKGYYILKAIKK